MTLPFSGTDHDGAEPVYSGQRHNIKYVSSDRLSNEHLNNIKTVMSKIVATGSPELFEATVAVLDNKDLRDSEDYVEAKRVVNAFNKYITDVANALKNDGRDNFDMIYAAQFIAERLDQGQSLPSVQDVRSELGQRSFKKPSIEYTETEEQRAKRVETTIEEHDRRRQEASKAKRALILLPVDTERRYKTHNGGLKIDVDSSEGFANHFTGKFEDFHLRNFGMTDLEDLDRYLADAASDASGSEISADSVDP